jgi:hypothetical protein
MKHHRKTLDSYKFGEFEMVYIEERTTSIRTTGQVILVYKDGDGDIVTHYQLKRHSYEECRSEYLNWLKQIHAAPGAGPWYRGWQTKDEAAADWYQWYRGFYHKEATR